MPDLLTHVLAGYVLGSLIAIRYEWADSRHVTVVMIGAVLPDVKKIGLLVSDETVTAVTGLPWEWAALHTLGGSIVLIALGALMVPPGYRVRVAALLAVGSGSHHVLDSLLITWSGNTYAVFWPISGYQPPAAGLFRSSDRWPALVAITLALALRRYRNARGADQSSDSITFNHR
ncbi:metal-dependent hydrolase [Natrarchaeobius oligotrophus]|uniref:Metal-dependent hydrolase n=1 Tax=Natrarchaeobius chitinivorans TaxID=1679083 RepID=A0A3N6MBS0_NATCH|nr:metal-dependent hydrolase [Natrarchaeobius chitinivorans]RQH01239.1 metal-dependent hydrolase [Natrarchaeobius chitinivorans]